MNSPVAPPDLHDDVATIPLPETRRTGRSRRDLRRRKQRRTRSLRFTAAVAVAVLVVLAAVGLFVSDATSDKGDDTKPGAAAAAPPPPAVLLAQRDAAGQAISLFVVAPDAGGKGGTIVLLPPGAMAEVASLDLQPLGQVLSLGGPARLQATVQNLLGATIGEVHVLDDAAITALVTPAAPIKVDIPERVEQVDARGTVKVLFESGPNDVAAADVPRLLAERGRSTDLSRLARHQAFWDAWLAKLKDPKAVPEQPPALAKLLRDLAAGPVRTRSLPVDPLGTGADGQLYQVDRAELAQLRSALFPGGQAATGGRPIVQILNGTGAVQLAQRVADKLGTAVEVKLTGNAARFDYTETQVVFYDRAKQADAQRVRDALGVGKLVFSRNPLDVVDVTIIVGKDFK
ncbi:MAG TPA: LytR C-terminal domain-containing protein [Acidimicrobiales bacterium]|nr:LytR C-terminal domain-containing protein [Acidimicrobiales bacterium]